MATKNSASQLAIADASALVSLAVSSDDNHVHARAIFTAAADAQMPIVIPAEVFAETINILGEKFGHAKALEAATLFLRADTMLVKTTTAVERQDGLDRFGQLPGSVSYTDALVMAVADLHGTSAIFGFDDTFSKNGYQLPSARKEAA